MAHVNRRQWERFVYPAELRLTATGHVLPAKLVDLSERGMQVIVPVKLYAGNAIRAELPTPRAVLAVTGRVCWVAADRTDGTAQTRAGVAFDALPTAAEQALRALACDRPGASVIVQLPGSDDPVRASAVRTDEGLRLSFALPFLREGTIVTLQSTEAEAEVARVVRTHVYAGGTGAETRVELLVEPCAETRKRRFVQYDAVSCLPQPVASAAAESDGAEGLSVPKQRVLAKLGYGVSLTAALWLVVRFTGAGTAEEPPKPKAAQVQASAPATATGAHAATDPRPVSAASTRDDLQLAAAPDARSSTFVPARVELQPAAAIDAHPSTDARPSSAASPRVELQPAAAIDAHPSSDARPSTASARVELQPAAAIDAHPSSDARPTAAPARAEPPAAGSGAQVAHEARPVSDTQRAPDTSPTTDTNKLAAAPRSAAGTRAPVVTASKDTTEIFVPISGSLAGLEAKLWVDPPAIAVEIPRGQVALPRRRYELQAGGVAGLSVGRPGGVTQLRVYVNSVLSQYEATAAPGGVLIRIKHDLQSPH